MQNLISDAAHATQLGIAAIGIRMLVALVFGALVGFERETKNRAAGLRTHILVCLASATVAMLTVEIVHLPAVPEDVVHVDPTRTIEAVTGGVAFLAAGLIVFTKGQIHGLTTGAGMWLAGAIGLACGLGLLQLAGLATILAVTVLWILAHFERRIAPQNENARIDD